MTSALSRAKAMPPRERDALIAEKLMGWKWRTFIRTSVAYQHSPQQVGSTIDAGKYRDESPGDVRTFEDTPRFNELNAMHEVEEKLAASNARVGIVQLKHCYTQHLDTLIRDALWDAVGEGWLSDFDRVHVTANLKSIAAVSVLLEMEKPA